jgi:uncharacterized protein (TIGR02246 family)
MTRTMRDSQQQSVDERAISALLERMAQAWEEGDADAYGANFTEDCRYIAFFGGIYRGRSEIVESHRALWKKTLRGTRQYSELLEIRFVAPDMALVVTQGDVAKTPPKTLSKVQSYCVVRQPNGQWLAAQFQNTKKLKLMRFFTYLVGPAAIPSIDR